jgi:hypothetical protein
MPTLIAADIDRRVKVIDGEGSDDRTIKRVSDLRAMPFVVLLGEPGIGKSTVLSREAASEGASVISVRELMTGTAVQPDVTLFLDALDEYRTNGGAEDKVHTLANAIASCNPPSWRLTCRSEDWRKAADIAPISKTTAGRSITVAQLLPLDSDEASAILTVLGEVDPAHFLKTAESFGATGFIENPLALKLLQSAVADGGTWPANRFQLFASATRKLAFERSVVRSVTERHGVDVILDAAAEAFLVLLTSGARAIWRSNNEPPAAEDARAYVTGHDLQIDHGLLGDMLDTPLFRGEGETFEPMHRTIAEFLAGKALAAAVRGSQTRAALPLARALALVTGNDLAPPTELRGLFAWFAAHFAVGGDAELALRLIETDPVTVLSYGDAAVFETSTRRALLNNLGRHDPYFRASEVGVTAVGGLAGEDLAEDFATILTDPADGTHRLLTVFEALTVGRPVLSLRPLLRALVLDETRPEWQRRRAVEAYLNGAEDPPNLRRELFNALATQSASAGREAIRAQLAGGFASGALTVEDVRSVLADFRRSVPDNMTGRLYSLQKRLELEPIPELFDDPIASWLPARDNHGRDHRIEINHLLDHALASAIRNTPGLSASRLWRWTANVRREAWTNLRSDTANALAGWLDEGPEREVAFFNAILSEDDIAGGPWLVSNRYITITRRHPSDVVLQHLLTGATASTDRSQKERLLAIAAEIAVSTQRAALYWATYDQIFLTGDETSLNRLTFSTVDEWRREQADLNVELSEEEERERVNAVEVLRPVLADIAVGQYPQHLEWAAQLYFEREGAPDIQRIVEKTDAATTTALLAGWNRIATDGLGEVNAARLGVAEAEQRRYYVESAAVAGVYRLLVDDRMPADRDIPIEVALAVLKSSWTANGNERQEKLDQWAIARLNVEPAAGAAQLFAYWNAAHDAGATDLPGIWKLQEEIPPGAAIRLALSALLQTRPNLPLNALRSAVTASAKLYDKTTMINIAREALNNSAVEGAIRDVWNLITFVLDPAAHAGLLDGERRNALIDLILDGGNSELVSALGGMADVDRLPTRVLMIRALGPRATPRDEFTRDGRVTERQRLSETVRNAVNALAGDLRPEVGRALADLASDPDLVEWHPSIRHAQAQQRRLMRDQNFKHPAASAVRAALDCGPPINASDLRAVVVSELQQLRAELRTTDTTPWKRYWNVDSEGKVIKPLIENECRDHLLDRLRDRLKKYHVAAALPEARRGEETRTDILMLTGAGRNLPVESKRHFHPEIWTAAATQLQGYAAAPGADGLGVYLVFWFGNDAHPTPGRPDGQVGPATGAELEAMLVGDLSADLRERTDVIVFDVSDPSASVVKKPRRKRAAR